jgi:hypothetical protein
MTRHTCIVTSTRFEAAKRLACIWIKLGYEFKIIPPINAECLGTVFYMERERETMREMYSLGLHF